MRSCVACSNRVKDPVCYLLTENFVWSIDRPFRGHCGQSLLVSLLHLNSIARIISCTYLINVLDKILSAVKIRCNVFCVCGQCVATAVSVDILVKYLSVPFVK